MNDQVNLFDLEERQPDTGRPGGKTWVFNGAERMSIQYSEMWDPALVLHAHENEQVNIVLGGHVLFRVEDEVFELTKGCIIRIPPNKSHGLEKKLSDEDFRVIQLMVPKKEGVPESPRTADKGHQGWPAL